MPTIENHSERKYEFPYETWDATGTQRTGRAKTLVFPRAAVTETENGESREEPGVLEVTDEDLKRMQAHHVAKSWFTPRQLVVRTGPAPAPARESKAARG